ncbi:MAG: M1 family metallopeptidase [Deinococcota bacterium]
MAISHGQIEPQVTNELANAPRYSLELSLADDLTSVTGVQTVAVTNTTNDILDELYFHLHPNLIGGEFTITQLSLAGIETDITFNDAQTLLQVTLPGGLFPGEVATVSLTYSLRVPQVMGRNYGILSLQEGILSLPHAYAILAVFDEASNTWDIDSPPNHGDLVYSDTAFYNVTLHGPVGAVIVSSGQTLSREVTTNRQTLQVEAGPARDFYVSASFDYEVLRAEVGLANGNVVGINSYYQPRSDTHKQRAEEVLEHTIDALELLSGSLAPYPYSEFDIVPMVTSALGLEFPGIIGLSTNLYEDVNIGRLPSQAYLESTVVHEVVHQWFYNLVGSDQVSEPWLDEATTQYLTLQYFRQHYGPRSGPAQAFRNGLEGRRHSVFTERKVGQAVADYSSREYGAIVYGLGPLVLVDLADLIGEEVLMGFFREYTLQNAWQRVDGEEFEEQLEAYCNCVLDEFFETWVR